MLVFSSHYTQFAGNQECLVNVKYSTASDIVILGICFLSGNTEEGFRGLGFRGLGVEECFLFVAHKLRRMRINPPSGAAALLCHLALSNPPPPDAAPHALLPP